MAIQTANKDEQTELPLFSREELLAQNYQIDLEIQKMESEVQRYKSLAAGLTADLKAKKEIKTDLIFKINGDQQIINVAAGADMPEDTDEDYPTDTELDEFDDQADPEDEPVGLLEGEVILPRNRWFNIYLHKFLRDDDDRALHDHPWASMSIILTNGYIEHLPGNRVAFRGPLDVIFRKPGSPHRVELFRDCLEFFTSKAPNQGAVLPTWTLFITGPHVREWGFHCPKGWVHWQEFTSPTDSSVTGRGCDDAA